MSDHIEDVFTVEETAERLRIHPDALRRLARQNKIGSLKSGRALTFPASVISAYIAANVTSAIPPNPFGLTDASSRRIRSSKGQGA